MDNPVVIVLSGSVAVDIEISWNFDWSVLVGKRVSRFLQYALHEKTARLISDTSSSGRGAVLVLPIGLEFFELQTVNW